MTIKQCFVFWLRMLQDKSMQQNWERLDSNFLVLNRKESDELQ